MKAFFAANWFKMIIGVAILSAGTAITYYYLIYLPGLTQSTTIVAAPPPQIEPAQTDITATVPTSTLQATTTSTSSSTQSNIATIPKKKTPPPIPAKSTSSGNSTVQNQVSTSSAPVATTTPTATPSSTTGTQTNQASSPSDPYFNVYPIGASTNRIEKATDTIAELQFSDLPSYKLGKIGITFGGAALVSNSPNYIWLTDYSDNQIPVSSFYYLADGRFVIVFDLSGYDNLQNTSLTFYLQMNDTYAINPLPGTWNFNASIASERDVFQTTNGIDPFEYKSFPIMLTSFSFTQN